MITKKGNVEVSIDGHTFGFRIGTWTFRQAQLALGVNSIQAVLEATGFATGNINVDAYLTFLYEAAVEYNRVMGINTDNLSPRDVSEWVDLMGGISGSLSHITDGLTQYVTKNAVPPATPEETKTT